MIGPRPRVREAGWVEVGCWGFGCEHQGTKKCHVAGIVDIDNDGNGDLGLGALFQVPRVSGECGGVEINEGWCPRLRCVDNVGNDDDGVVGECMSSPPVVCASPQPVEAVTPKGNALDQCTRAPARGDGGGTSSRRVVASLLPMGLS